MSRFTAIPRSQNSTIGRSFNNLRLSPVSRGPAGWLGQLVVSLFCHAPRRRGPPRAPLVARGPAPMELRVADRRLTLHEVGDGPTVLLVHGWGGASRQWSPLARRLVEAGYRVVAFDLPGHGASSGSSTDVGEMARLTRRVAHVVGPLHGIIAHSLGSAAVARALADGLRAERVAFVAAATHPHRYWRWFKGRLRLPRWLARAADGALARRAGRPARAFAMDHTLREAATPHLFVHDTGDRVAPLKAVREVVEQTGGILATTRGLGHGRILEDSSTHRRILAFLRGEAVDTREHDPFGLDARELELELFQPHRRWAA